jgi:hypothetical protein
MTFAMDTRTKQSSVGLPVDLSKGTTMQVNDTVLVHIKPRPYDTKRMSIGKVIEETKSAWRVKYGDGLGHSTSLFRKTDLHLKSADSFCCTHIEPYTEEEWQKHTTELFRRTAIRSLVNFEWDKVDTVTLKKIHHLAFESKKNLTNAQKCD